MCCVPDLIHQEKAAFEPELITSAILHSFDFGSIENIWNAIIFVKSAGVGEK